jgi:hypothetical protein
MKSFTPGLYRASNDGVVKCRSDFAAANTYPPDIFLEALGGHLADGEIIYTRLTAQDRAIYDKIQARFGVHNE